MALGLTVTPNDPEANTDVPRLLSSTQTAREFGASPSPLVNDTALTQPPVPARAVLHKSRQSGEQALSYVSRPSDDTSTVDKYSQHLVYSSRPTSRQYIQPAVGLNRPSPAALAGGHGRTVNKASSFSHGSPRRSSFAGSPPRSRSSQIGYPSAQHGAPITENHTIVHEPGATGKDAKQSHTFHDGVTLALDAEKALPSAGGPRHSQAVLSNLSSQDAIHSTYSYSSDDDEVEIDEFVLQQQTIRALLYLSALALPISLALACYALIVLLVNVLATPLHICFLPNRLYTQQLSARLTPPLRFQFRILYGPQVAASVRDVPPSSAWRLTMTHVVAPLLVMPLTMAAWTAAVVWGLSAMVADEQVGSASDHERRWAGKVVGVWVWWLEQNVIPESEEAGRHGRRDMRGVTEITRGGAKVERVTGSHAVRRK